MGVPPATASRTDSAVDRLAAAGRSPRLVVGEGALGMAVGVVMLAWPGATATVLALLFSVQLLITGVLQLAAASSAAATTGARALSWGRCRSWSDCCACAPPCRPRSRWACSSASSGSWAGRCASRRASWPRAALPAPG